MPNCLTCGIGIDEFDSAYYSRSMLCVPCWTLKCSAIAMANCSRCGVRVRQDEARQRRGSYYCNYCISELERLDRLPECYLCTKKIQPHEKSVKPSGARTAHLSCAQKILEEHEMIAICSVCLAETKFFKVLPDGKVLCLKCARRSPQQLSAEQSGKSSHDHPLMGRMVTRLRGLFAAKKAEPAQKSDAANALERMMWKRIALRQTPTI
ncbi:MAG: hypothetical protein QW568_04420 [Candidatus Anstonellaceae archaeon]